MGDFEIECRGLGLQMVSHSSGVKGSERRKVTGPNDYLKCGKLGLQMPCLASYV